MKLKKLSNQKITFESFLCGISARDYIYQDINYDKQIRNAAIMIHNAEYVLIGAGAGMIRFPFEKLVREHDNISLIRLNLEQAAVPESFGERAIGINADMAESIKDIVKEVKRK